MSLAVDEPEPIVRANLRRRALEIMGEVCLATTPMMLGNELELSEPEHTRLSRLLDRVGELMAEGGDAFREHAIHIRQLAEWIGVFVDGQLIVLGPGHLAGTVSVYPALGSEIAVRQIEVVGDLDLGQIVNGPSGTAR